MRVSRSAARECKYELVGREVTGVRERPWRRRIVPYRTVSALILFGPAQNERTGGRGAYVKGF